MIGHGSGGRMMHELIENVFISIFDDPLLTLQDDSAVMDPVTGNLAFTTDSYVVQPLFFPGGDIGKLAVCGTVNDLAAAGAKPLYLSAAFIIEEGMETETLIKVVRSMADAAREAGVRIVCGDTKVVGKGQCDQLFITTSGVGEVVNAIVPLVCGKNISHGDRVILSGTIGDHGMAVLAARNDLNVKDMIESDCAPLNSMVQPLLDMMLPVKFMRDPTRGGLAATLCEIVNNRQFGILIDEEAIPINKSVRGMCELFGFDPLYVANEGKMVIVVPDEICDEALNIIRRSEYGKRAAVIGTIEEKNPGMVIARTIIGGKRIITMPAGEQLPRIC